MKKRILYSMFFSMLMFFSSVGALAVSKSIENNTMIKDSSIPFNDIIDDVGWYTSLALDGNGYPHISYYDYSNGDLKYAFWTGSSWNFEIVDSSENVGRYTAIALDDANNPHISYYDYGNGNLKYATKTGGSWDITSVDSLGDVGLYTSIALDSEGYPHISYCDYTKKALKYAFWNGQTWDKSVVDNSGDICVFEYFGDTTSIAIDSQDYPHISYCDYGNYNLKYVFWTGSSWSSEVVDEEGEVGHYSSLVLDENDNPQIGYDYLTKGSALKFDLKYATKTGGNWNIETVDSEGDIRKWISLKLDSNSFPHISYYDYTEGSLKYCFYNDESWVFDTVESEGSTGCFNSLSLDSDNKPCISYYDWGSKALKYAALNADNWDIQTLEIDTNTDFLDQEQNYCCGYANGVFEDDPVAQSFIPSYSVLTRVELMIVKRYNPKGFTVSIRDDLEEEDLISVYLNADEIAEDMSWKNFDFPDIEVTPDQTYYIVCTSEGTEEYNMFWWYYGIYDSYPNGCGWIQTSRWKVLTASGFPEMDLGFKTFGLDTSIPSPPSISGPDSGNIGVTYDYEIASEDNDGDEISYYVDWGDGDYLTFGPFPSGSSSTVSHAWSRQGTYNIKAKAFDVHGAESDWTELSVSMPKSKPYINTPFLQILENLLQNHPHLFPLLQKILQRL